MAMDGAVRPEAIRQSNTWNWLGAGLKRSLLLMPAILLVAAIVIVPTLMAVKDSFLSYGQWTVSNYVTVLWAPPYPSVLKNTIVISLWVTIASMALALPAAAFLSLRNGLPQRIALGIIGSTLWISILVKVYAWQVLLARNGPLNSILTGSGLAKDDLPLLYTRGAVVVSMIQFMVPYACILLVAGMRRVDWDLITAARTLGARPFAVFREAYWPQVRFTVVMSALMVFVISSSFFVAPALLGGPHDTMIGIKMKSDLTNQYDSGLAATAGTVLTVVLLVLSALALKLAGGSLHKRSRGNAA